MTPVPTVQREEEITNMFYGKYLAAKDLKLGDIIKCSYSDIPFDTGIIKKEDINSWVVFRPYGVSEDFTYTGGVICYTGLEEFRINKDDHGFLVYSRKDLK